MTTSEWMDEGLAARWTAADSLKEFLALPRRLSATVVAADRPGAVSSITPSAPTECQA